MSCPETTTTSAFLDGELDDEAAALAEAHIATCAECQAFAAGAADISEALRAPSARFKAPPLLEARVRRRLAAEDRPRRQFLWGALSGVGVSAAAASLGLVLTAPPAPERLSLALADAHIQALQSGKTIAVVSTSHHTVKPWFAGKVPLSPPVGDFAPQGFPLKGGRVDRVLGRPAAVVVYAHGAHEIDLYAWKTAGGALPAAAVRAGYRQLFWRQGDLTLAAVSDVDQAELARFAGLVKALGE